MNDDNPIRIILADDHVLVLDGLQARLSMEPGFEVVATANNGREALAAAQEHQPDLAILDVSMPELNGLETTKRFRRDLPDVRLLMLSMHDDREYILPLIRSGASGYVLKDVSSDELIAAIRTVHSGNTYFSAGASRALFQHEDNKRPRAGMDELSSREIDVLKLLVHGHSNKEVGAQLNISVRTVETHRQNIKTKLGIQRIAGLTRYAMDQGLI